MNRFLRLLILALPATLAVGTGEARAQIFIALTDRDPDSVFKFNLSTPGARSLAMGGAFIGLSDDATAAYTNPAGLTNLTLGGSEVAVELRQTRFTNSFLDGGHISAVPGIEPTASGVGIDFGTGLRREETTSDLGGVSFLSFGWVLPRGLTLAFYRHELANFETAFEAQGLLVDEQPLAIDEADLDQDGDDQEAFCDLWFPDPVFDENGNPFVDQEGNLVDENGNLLPFSLFEASDEGLCPSRLRPKRSRANLEIVNYGVSAAIEFKLPSIALSLGVGASYYELEIDGRIEFYGVDEFNTCTDFDDPACRLPGSRLGPADFATDNLLPTPNVGLLDQEQAKDEDLGINLGFLLKLGKAQRWSVGGVFREGPNFESEFIIDNYQGLPLDELEEGRRFPSTVTIPDVIGLGIAYRSREGNTKITLDANRVRYSQRLPDFIGDGVSNAIDEDISSDYRIQDADQIHLGVERIVLVVESLFVGTVRFGVWNEPYHELEYVGPETDVFEREVARQTLDRPADDELHYSFGLGLVIKEDYQIDLAVDLSDPTDTFSFSVVKFF